MSSHRGRRPRNTSKMQECCFNGDCFNNFKDLAERIEYLSGKPLLDYIHESPTGLLINKIPRGTKWNDFLFDYWDYKSQCDFKEELITTLDVNRFENDKIFVNWRVLDRYKGRFGRHGLTRNMIDIRIYIPDRNLAMEEHFCYRYFCRSRGSPQSLICNILKEGIGHLYNRYYVDNDYKVLIGHEGFRCYTGSCNHDMNGSVPDYFINLLPDWYYENTCPPGSCSRKGECYFLTTNIISVLLKVTTRCLIYQIMCTYYLMIFVTLLDLLMNGLKEF